LTAHGTVTELAFDDERRRASHALIACWPPDGV
jgi:hypothetical protein